MQAISVPGQRRSKESENFWFILNNEDRNFRSRHGELGLVPGQFQADFHPGEE